MLKPICAAVPVYVIDLDDQREFTELVDLLARRTCPAPEKIAR